MKVGVLQGEFHFAFAQHGRLIRRDQAHVLDELADPGGPAVEDTELERDDRQLRDAEEVDDADQKKISGDLLPDLLAQQRALQVGKNSSGLHLFPGF